MQTRIALSVDKDPIASIMTQVVLEHLEFRVRQINQVRDALSSATNEAADLLLIPINLNDDDQRALSSLRTNPRTANLRTVATLENERANVEGKCHELGFDSRIIKPIGLVNMQAVIDRLNRTNPGGKS
jgi:CheY-like chemotaxis protein